jgi:hypothetical protein
VSRGSSLFSVQVSVGNHEVETLGDPAKIVPLLAGPGGAIAALLLFVAYLLRELAAARSERNSYMTKYENMRESRDEFRFLAADWARTGKRAVQTAVATGRDRQDD